MSFAKFDVEAQKGPRPGSSLSGTNTKGKGEEFLDRLSESVSEYANNLNKFEKNLQALGSKRDNSKLRSILQVYFENLKNLSRLLEKESQDSSKKQTLSDKEALIYEKVSLEFRRLDSKFSSVLNEYHEKIANFPINEELESQLAVQEEEDSRKRQYDQNAPLLQQQQQQPQYLQEQQLNERELQYHQYLIQLRSQDINLLSNGVEDINVIFKDLNNLIQQQGQQVDRIEDNLITYTNNNQFATEQLVKLDSYQRKKSRWCFMILIAVIVLFVIVLLIIS